MIKRILSLCLCLFLFASLFAEDMPDEGMWLPLYLKSLNEKDMQKLGLRLSVDDIYSINHSSLKDAVVSLGGFCTAEIVSAEGLLLTNHHCGYESITEHSTIDHDYLNNGFWAKKHEDEMPNMGLTASILVSMADETTLINNAVGGLTGKERRAKLGDLEDSISKAAMKDNHYKASVHSFFNGNEYYLLVYEVFTDVRLVGAPPAAIGKFGGETDNWMWPRHTGDFSVFRIYVDKDNNPAAYSKDNVPYKPKYFIPISLKGEKKDDYTMVYGFPGSTTRYLSADDLIQKRDYDNPALISGFKTMLDIMKQDMDADPKLKLALSSDFAEFSNTYKFFVGEEKQLGQSNYISQLQGEEVAFKQWVNADDARKKKYGTVLDDIITYNNQAKTIEPMLGYIYYAFFATKAVQYGFNYYAFTRPGSDKLSKKEADTIGNGIKPDVKEYFAKNETNTDKKILKAELLLMYANIPAEKRPDIFKEIMDKHKNATPEVAINDYIDEMYKKSELTDEKRALSFLSKPNIKKLEKDPYYKMVMDLYSYYATNLQATNHIAQDSLNKAHKRYMQALREWKTNEKFYPDANSTLRLTYGQVEPYLPKDAVAYKYYTTYEGILQKYDAKDPEFAAPKDEIALFKEKKFGRYAKDDTLHICFITNNDITGGNSGSPVLNADGQLIGLAFDGDWESMLSDVHFDPATNRTICVDIRYVLWIMDVYAHADNLIKEMTIVE